MNMFRVGQNRIYTSYMAVYLVVSLPNKPNVRRIYMALANPGHSCTAWGRQWGKLDGQTTERQCRMCHPWGQPALKNCKFSANR
jgi:hypothetical protein